MYRKKLFYLLLVSTIIRMVLASVLELGNDEVYYYFYAQHLQSNYFDHPPGIAFLIRLFTFNLHFTAEFFVRLGSICCAAIGTMLVYKIGSFIKSSRVGWFAAVFYNTSIYCSVIAGTFILPDSPQIIFWLASVLLILILINKIELKRPASILYWILFGITNGLCIMCKVHGIFIWAGFGLYILLYNRKILSIPALYLSFLVTLLIIFPVFWWNYQNHFVTYNYHSSRVGVNHFKPDTDSFLQTFLGQWFYNSPINVVVIFMGTFVCIRKRLIENNFLRILICCGLPIILVVTIMSLFNPVLPHWSGPGFLTLSFLGAVYVDSFKQKKLYNPFPVILKWMCAFTIILLLAGVAFIKFYPGTIGNKNDEKLGENDFTLDLSGWNNFGNSFNAWYKDEIKRGELPAGLKIICNKWFPAAHIDYYVAPKISSYVFGFGEMNDLHHYVWLNQYRGSLKEGENVLCIVPSNYPADVQKIYGQAFSQIMEVKKILQTRGGAPGRYFTIYYLKNFHNLVYQNKL